MTSLSPMHVCSSVKSYYSSMCSSYGFGRLAYVQVRVKGSLVYHIKLTLLPNVVS